ncbi:alpha/beta fold hydrolase [Kushneria indalinina]|uniref:Pimeloyl-[acyl-carrier protein] methyl ester esterase n=1 Tax=Kushneria indalinina DSM 14324 TaxID=1122140 RepID=A0A3D9DWS3_9GAMM|nr:alpha/beta fold hydrolase [Kushneria indalinina]REC95228.1 pimeloyl-[acyl-carrier protein] methyl ester esterase [Kushneria indalinina DSM 14324]
MMTASPTLILLPGWAMAPSSLMALAAELKAQLPGWVIDCPPLPATSDDTLEIWLDDLDARLPEHAWLAGWSLGGMLAMALAERRRGRCPGVITLGSNLSFVTRHDWRCALPPATLATFQGRWESAPERTRSRFFALVARGSASYSSMIRYLEAHAAPMRAEQALAGLSLLAHIDLQARPIPGHCPRLHLFAELDALVPSHAGEAIHERHPDSSTVRQLADTGHAFPLEHPEQCARLMATFIKQSGTGDAHEH